MLKNKFDFLLNILVLILVILFNRTNTVFGANINWFEVSRTSAGIQYLDRDSIDIEEKGIIELTTKYIKIDSITSKEIEENIYIMKSIELLINSTIFQLIVKRIYPQNGKTLMGINY